MEREKFTLIHGEGKGNELLQDSYVRECLLYVSKDATNELKIPDKQLQQDIIQLFNLRRKFTFAMKNKLLPNPLREQDTSLSQEGYATALDTFQEKYPQFYEGVFDIIERYHDDYVARQKDTEDFDL